MKDAASVSDAPSEHGEPKFRWILRDPVAVGVTLFMGLQSVSYYTALTWVPTILTNDGMDPNTAGLLLAYSAFPGVLASLITPSLAGRMVKRPGLPVIIAVALIAAAYVGLAIFAASGSLLWMTLLGLGQGASISLSLTYIVWRSPDTHHTGHLSTMSQGFGYLLAGLGPLGIGAVYSATGGWTWPMLALGFFLAIQLVAGLLASRNAHIRGRGIQAARMLAHARIEVRAYYNEDSTS